MAIVTAADRPAPAGACATVGTAAAAGGPGTCAAEHWGAATGDDYARAVGAGWTRVECGTTRNAFWRLP